MHLYIQFCLFYQTYFDLFYQYKGKVVLLIGKQCNLFIYKGASWEPSPWWLGHQQL